MAPTAEPAKNDGRRDAWVVSVTDHVDERIAGHPGRPSPPQPRAFSLALVALLIGSRDGDDGDDGDHWSVATAGGRRVVDLEPAD